MDKKAIRTLLLVIVGISFFALLMCELTLFSNFTIGKGSMDIANEEAEYIAKAGKIVYWFSGAGFFILLPFIIGLVFTCFAKRRKVCLFAAIYGIVVFVAFIVFMVVANTAAYSKEYVLDSAYLLISAFQLNLIQATVPTVLLVIWAFVMAAKCGKYGASQETVTEFDESYETESEEEENV